MRTESALLDWRYGQSQAERLVAALLHLEGFEEIDPQHPLGGPDGVKDVLCRKNGLNWIAAAFFASTKQSFAKVKAKFEHDVAGVAKNRAQAFAFFVNQHVSIEQRAQLRRLGKKKTVEVYHLERMRVLLDAPKGCGIRLQYLRIAMTEEEQWAFWSSVNQDVMRRLVENERAHEARIRSIDEKLDVLLVRTNAMELPLTLLASHLARGATQPESIEMPTATLSLTTLCWLHRVVTEGTSLPNAIRGRFRSIEVWLGKPGAERSDATYSPPPPEQVIELTRKHINWWTATHAKLRRRDKNAVVAELARLHHGFLRIHPFLDGNGRVARSVLDQAARELLNESIGPEFTQGPTDYYAALAAADSGDMRPLEARILAALQ